MSTISKEAKDEAVRVYWSIGDPISNIAAALQRHLDETARQAEHTAHYVREAADQRQRAEAAERGVAELVEEMLALRERADKAEAELARRKVLR